MMNPRHLPLLMLGAWVLFDCLLAALCWSFNNGTLAIFLFLVIWGQFIVLTGWVVVGQYGIKVTTLGALAGLVICGALAENERGAWYGAIGLTVYGLVYAIILNLPLAAARGFGWRFCLIPQSRNDTIRLYQISIRDILVFTVLIGIVGAVWNATSPPPPPPSTDDGWAAMRQGLGEALRRAFLIGIVLAFPVPWSIWGIFCWLRPVHAAMACLVVSGLWGVFAVRIAGVEPPHSPLGVFLLVLVPPGVMLAHIFTLQWRGFRWQHRAATQQRVKHQLRTLTLE
jgi:hypothetical protein